MRVVALLVALAGSISMWLLLWKGAFSQEVWKREKTDDIVSFVEKHKDERSCALMIKRNNKVVYAINPEVVLPLASTVKLMVALEFAQQAASGKLYPDDVVSLRELKTYYVPKTDGGAHEKWQEYVMKQKLAEEGVVSLEEVARGMLLFSSNANMEYLMGRLGLQNINHNIGKLGLPHHQQLFPAVAALYIPGYLHKEKHLSRQQVLHELQVMPEEEYRRYAELLHEQMKQDSSFQKRVPLWFNQEYEKLWSDRLPAASVTDYVLLLEKINSKAFFPEPVQKQWDRIAEESMDETWKKQLRYTGHKNGYTSSVLANAAYATDQKGNRTEVVFLANNIHPDDSQRLRNEFKQFHLRLFTSEDLYPIFPH